MKMLEIVDALLLKNRTIVSSDFEDSLALLATEIPLTIHRYPSGSEYGTWVAPPQWDVKRAVLSDGDRTLASYEDHPLFLAPYSTSFTGWVTREQLLKHVRSSPERPEEFVYEYRLAYNYRMRLKDWAITLPHATVQRLDKPRYYVDIEVESKPGHMLVGESVIHGQQNYTFAFLTHLCHPGQANDGLAGVAVGTQVMKRLRQEYSQPKYNYQLLILPETIGSSVYLSAQEDSIDTYLGSVFIEMPGIRSPLYLKLTRRGNTYLDRVLQQVLRQRGEDFVQCGFREGWGNDELIFDSPGVGIPGASIQRSPFHWYHTSGDNLAGTDESRMEEVVEVLLEAVELMESDFVPVPLQKVPVYLSRYGLYDDNVQEPAKYQEKVAILDALWSGESVFDIAHSLDVDYSSARSFVAKLVDLDLVEAAPLTPEYFRRGPKSRIQC